MRFCKSGKLLLLVISITLIFFVEPYKSLSFSLQHITQQMICKSKPYQVEFALGGIGGRNVFTCIVNPLVELSRFNLDSHIWLGTDFAVEVSIKLMIYVIIDVVSFKLLDLITECHWSRSLFCMLYKCDFQKWKQLGLHFSERIILRGYCTPDQFCDCLCIFLKNYNTLVTSYIMFLIGNIPGNLITAPEFTNSSGYWFLAQSMENFDFRTFITVTSQQWSLLK